MSTEATAATMTFVVYVDDAGIAAEARERSQALVEKHRARLVFVDATEEPQLAPEERKAYVRDRLVPGVPSVLFWAGIESIGDPNFLALNEVVDSLVLDSSRGSGGIGALRQLIEYFSQGRRFKVQDLAYLRLAPWQEMIAGFFDDPELAGDLASIEKVAIVAGSPAEQYYLLGWLGSRLGWKPHSISYTLASRGKPRRIYDVALTSAGTTYRAALQGDDERIVCLTVEGVHAREMHCDTIHDVSVVALAEQAVLRPQTSDVYRATLEATRAFLDRTHRAGGVR